MHWKGRTGRYHQQVEIYWSTETASEAASRGIIGLFIELKLLI